MIKIGHARINEIGTISGGTPGDQTGQEVCVQDFVEHEWTWYFRPISPEMAKKIVQYVKDICANDMVGYGQSDRYGMYMQARAIGWQFAMISSPCSTDCSQLVASVLIALGLDVSPYMYTGSERGIIMATGAFEEHVYKNKEELLPGDILLTITKGHTAVVVEADDHRPSRDPKYVGETYGAQTVPVYQQPSESSPRCAWPTLGLGNLYDVCDELDDWIYIRIAGTYYGWIRAKYCLRKTPQYYVQATGSVWIREKPSTTSKKVGCINQSQYYVQACDVKRGTNGRDWYYVLVGNTYGFSSSLYLKRV